MAEDNPFRSLPQVQRLMLLPEAADLVDTHGRAALTAALRTVLGGFRARLADRSAASAPDGVSIVDMAGALLAARARPGLRRVINASGIVIHTNLGRAPLAREAIDAVVDVAAGYSNLEFDHAEGTRGPRAQAIEPLLCDVTGAEAGITVNNGAAAILLALAALAGNDDDVIVSRGELIEIGGGFRIPDVIRQGGARLVEVGSTNKTHLADYAAAITPQTRVLLKVHQSNFRMTGFTADTEIADLSALARECGLLVVADLGSGLVARHPASGEPTISAALAAGADLVTCSGDKLLGGPQAGLALGRAAAVDPLRRHPLMRALRCDKMTLAALESTLRLHRDRPEEIPVLHMIGQGAASLRARAEQLRDLAGTGDVVVSDGFTGGGALPQERIVSAALSLDPAGGADAAAALLRIGDPPIIGRIHDGRLLIDVLAVSESEMPVLAAALRTLV